MSKSPPSLERSFYSPPFPARIQASLLHLYPQCRVLWASSWDEDLRNHPKTLPPPVIFLEHHILKLYQEMSIYQGRFCLPLSCAEFSSMIPTSGQHWDAIRGDSVMNQSWKKKNLLHKSTTTRNVRVFYLFKCYFEFFLPFHSQNCII